MVQVKANLKRRQLELWYGEFESQVLWDLLHDDPMKPDELEVFMTGNCLEIRRKKDVEKN